MIYAEYGKANGVPLFYKHIIKYGAYGHRFSDSPDFADIAQVLVTSIEKSSSPKSSNISHNALYNKTDEFQEFKENVEGKKSANLNKKSLIDFYRDGQEGADLGLYYLSYLDEACKKENVKFESLVNQFSSNDLTVISLTFNF